MLNIQNSVHQLLHYQPNNPLITQLIVGIVGSIMGYCLPTQVQNISCTVCFITTKILQSIERKEKTIHLLSQPSPSSHIPAYYQPAWIIRSISFAIFSLSLGNSTRTYFLYPKYPNNATGLHNRLYKLCTQYMFLHMNTQSICYECHGLGRKIGNATNQIMNWWIAPKSLTLYYFVVCVCFIAMGMFFPKHVVFGGYASLCILSGISTTIKLTKSRQKAEKTAQFFSQNMFYIILGLLTGQRWRYKINPNIPSISLFTLLHHIPYVMVNFVPLVINFFLSTEERWGLLLDETRPLQDQIKNRIHILQRDAKIYQSLNCRKLLQKARIDWGARLIFVHYFWFESTTIDSSYLAILNFLKKLLILWDPIPPSPLKPLYLPNLNYSDKALNKLFNRTLKNISQLPEKLQKHPQSISQVTTSRTQTDHHTVQERKQMLQCLYVLLRIDEKWTQNEKKEQIKMWFKITHTDKLRGKDEDMKRKAALIFPFVEGANQLQKWFFRDN